MYSTSDSLRKLLGQDTSRRCNAKILKGKIWLAYCMFTKGMSLQEFSDHYLEGRHGGASSLIYKWVNGKAVPSKQTVTRIAKDIADSGTLYELPLWWLLENKPLKDGDIDRQLEPYWVSGALKQWAFPRNRFANDSYPYSGMLGADVLRLVERGDIYGLMALVGLTRKAECEGDADLHWFFCSYAYRAIPAVGKLPWVKDSVPLLLECMSGIHSRFMTSAMMFEVDRGVIERQIDDSDYQTVRVRRKRDRCQRYIEPEDPIIMRIREGVLKR